MKLGKTIFALSFAMAVAGICSATAETIGYADAYDKIVSACGADMKKLCSGASLGNGGVQQCLTTKQDRVSPGCKAVVAATFQQLAERRAAQSSARRVCDADIRRLCQGVVADDAHQLNCLLTATRSTSATCKQVITDAGWQ